MSSSRYRAEQGARQMFRLALRWENIDWTFGRASITHTLVRTRARVEWARAEEPAVAPDGVAPPILLEALRGEETVQSPEHSRRKSMASRSKSRVNWLPGSAYGIAICLTPC